jgi:trimeric autotransporter adhesin
MAMRETRIRSGRRAWAAPIAGILLLTSGLAWGVEPRSSSSHLGQKEFFKPELYISTSHERVEEVLEDLPNRTAWESFLEAREHAGEPPVRAFVDPRSGVATNLLGPFPLIPGRGAGNRVSFEELSARIDRPVGKVDPTAVADAVRAFVQEKKALLGVDTAQLGATRAVQVAPDLWQIDIPQTYRGVPVRHGRLAATLNHGNLVLIGAETWGNVRGLSTLPKIGEVEAVEAGFGHVGGASAADVIVRRPLLEIVPVAPPEHQRGEGFGGQVGAGYRHRLAWTFAFRRRPDLETWEVIVDAHDGEVLAFQDLNRYATHQIKGGVYPLTSTEICPTNATCGTMQSGWPMPFADTGLASPHDFANSAGLFDWNGSPVTTTLSGRYVDIFDLCGPVTDSSSDGTLDLGGTNGQHDCATDGSGSTTASARSAFYEVNKLAEMARGWLPGNTWLTSQLETNVNITDTCNAFWDGFSINFFRSGGGCRNTGELAGVFDHEWGHGLDHNDANGTLSSSAEAYADIAAIYRLQASCIGHGFFWTSDKGCGPTADGTGFNQNEAQTGASHCDLDCSGVRDADWDKHSDHTPDTPLGFVCASCFEGFGPCGRQEHCAAAPSRQAAWDFAARDLQAAPFNYDSQTAFILANKIFYQGSGNIGSWHACTCGSSSSGCGATNGYMQWLAADDDNGNLNDGTPHMTALFNAFNRHGIACATPAAVNSGCAGGPTAAPALSVTAGDFQTSLSWGAVAGATRYWVFRSEGHAGCDFGKTLTAEVTGTSYLDTQLAGGRSYSYNVVAVGASSACFGRASNCATAVPTAPPPPPDLALSCVPSSLTVSRESSTATTCTVTSIGGFAGGVSLICAGLPAGSSCSFSSNPVLLPANGSASSTLTVSADAAAAIGSFGIQVHGVSSALARSASLSLTVNPKGAQTAVFDPVLQTPKCATVGNSCDSGPSLLLGRDTISGGAEPNQPNTLFDSCSDGSGGAFHGDESNDRLKVSTVDGTDFAPGKTVRIDATVWAWTGSPSSDHLDLYSAADANSPVWTYLTTLTPIQGGTQILSATYTLPSGTLQAVRARFRFNGSPAACEVGSSFDDHDDLVFAVGTSSAGMQTAVFDPVRQAPRCATVGIACDSGPSLLRGRGTMSGGAEPNQPNTINDSCADGAAGTFHGDESNDRLKVSTTDGSAFAPGKTVRIDATVWVWSGGPTSDRLDLYYAANANSPVWTHLTTIVPTTTQSGARTFSATYTLPAGALQAVRARFRNRGSLTPCGTGAYDDHDDLIFAVSP